MLSKCLLENIHPNPVFGPSFNPPSLAISAGILFEFARVYSLDFHPLLFEYVIFCIKLRPNIVLWFLCCWHRVFVVMSLCISSNICLLFLFSVVLLSFAKTGNTALIYASRNGYKDIVRMLLECKANVNAANSGGAFGDISDPIQADLLFFQSIFGASLIFIC